MSFSQNLYLLIYICYSKKFKFLHVQTCEVKLYTDEELQAQLNVFVLHVRYAAALHVKP